MLLKRKRKNEYRGGNKIYVRMIFNHNRNELLKIL